MIKTERSKGDLAILAATASDQRRLGAGLQHTADGCAIWTGSHAKDGYGQIWCQGTTVLAHRLAWFFEHGDLPALGLEIDHTCSRWDHPDAIRCCAPAHLEAVSGAENKRRQRERNLAIPACRNGHPWRDETTYWHNGQRQCTACRSQAHARSYARAKALAAAARGNYGWAT